VPQRWRCVVGGLQRQNARLGSAGRSIAAPNHTCPKIVETFGGLEFWNLRESTDLVGTDAKADLPLPANARRYFFPGTTHGGGRGGSPQRSGASGTLPAASEPRPRNRNHERADLGAGRLGDQRHRTSPSVIPRLDNAQLVCTHQAAMGASPISGRLRRRL